MPCHKGMAARVVKVLEATLMACIGLRLGTCVCLAPVSQASQGTALTLHVCYGWLLLFWLCCPTGLGLDPAH